MPLLDALFGPEKAGLSWWQETDRAMLVFFVGLALIRVSGLRTFSRYSPLDAVVAIVIGSNLSRALTGAAPLWATLAASLAFVLLHRVLCQAAFHFHPFGVLLKGRPKVLIEGGVLQRKAMRREAVTEHDLEEALRLRGLKGLDDLEHAALERNGSISLRPRSKG